MTARAFLDKLRAIFSLDSFPLLNKALDALRNETAEDAALESVLDRAGAMIADATAAANGFMAAARQAGIETIEQLTALTARAKDGAAYRAQLIADTLAAGVRAHGEDFHKQFFESILNDPARSVDDIKVFHDQFTAEATRRLGEPGRMTTPPDPNAKADVRDMPFDKLSPEEQKRVVSDFLERTARK